jgi:Ribonuclease G/E
MSDAWLIDETIIETRLARLIGERLALIRHFPRLGAAARQARVGDVFLARAGARRAAAGGQFLDLGDCGEGFLREGAKPLSEGTLVLTSVVQAAIGAKAPRLARGVNMAGRYLSLTWQGSPNFQPTDIQATAQLQVREREQLTAALATIRADAAAASGPGRMAAAPDAVRTLIIRAKAGDQIRIAGVKSINSARAMASSNAPELAGAITAAPTNLFEEDGIEAEIEAALEPEVKLPGGGRMIIEMTQALTAIDVDAGGARHIVEVNAQAARALPREIAVRELAGTILIDFARVRERAELDALSALIAAGALELGIEIEIGGRRRGLLELRRPRAQASLATVLTRSGATHLGIPRVLSYPAQAARLARALGRAGAHVSLEARLPPTFLAWLEAEGREFAHTIGEGAPAGLRLVAAQDIEPDGFELVEAR